MSKKLKKTKVEADPPQIYWPGPIIVPPTPMVPAEPTAVDFLADWKTGLWSGLTGAIQGLGQTLLEGFDEEGLRGAFEGSKTELEGKYKEEVKKPIEDVLNDTWDLMDRVSAATHLGAVGLLIGTSIASLTPWPLGPIGEAVDEVWRLPFISAMLGVTESFHRVRYDYVYGPRIQRLLYSENTPLVPEPYRLALAASKEIITNDEYKEAMAENGLNGDWADYWKEEMHEYPALGETLALLRRGEIDDSKAKSWMIKRAMPGDAADQVLKLKDVIPDLETLRLIAVREAIPGYTYEQLWDWYEEWAGKMGLSSDFAEYIRRAAWVRMDVRTAMRYFLWYNNLPEDFETWLRIADIHEDDRPRIAAVSYTVPTIRELGYGYDTGDYTEEDIEMIRRRGGLCPEDAKKATRALVAYRTEAEREAVRREWLHLYALGKRTKGEFKEKLVELSTNPKAIELWLERAELEKERRTKEPTVEELRIVSGSDALWALEHGIRDEGWVRSRLEELFWDDRKIQLAIDEVKQRLKEKEKPPKPVTYRDLTPTQIRDLYRMEKLLRDDVEARLIKIGYSPDDAKLLAELLTYSPPEERRIKPYTDAWSRRLYAQRLLREGELYRNYRALDYDDEHATKLTLSTLVGELLPSLIARYRKGWLNEEGFIRELVWIGVEVEDAIDIFERVLHEFQLERLERERDLTKSEILKGVKNKLISPREGSLLLQDLGYDEWEAIYILEVNKVVAAGDPEGYWEMRKVTEALKKARGEPYREIPQDVLDLEKAIVDKKREIKKAEDEKAPESKIAELNVELGELERTLRGRIIDLKLG